MWGGRESGESDILGVNSQNWRAQAAESERREQQNRRIIFVILGARKIGVFGRIRRIESAGGGGTPSLRYTRRSRFAGYKKAPYLASGKSTTSGINRQEWAEKHPKR